MRYQIEGYWVETQPLPAGLPDGHVCHCWECDPSLKDEGLPLHEGHLAVRLGDIFPPPDSSGIARFFLTTVNGQLVREVYEVVAQSRGWVLHYVSPMHVCQSCGGQACAERLDGDVKTQIGPWPEQWGPQPR